MSIYMVTWKTVIIDGKYSEGSFIAEKEIASAEEAIKVMKDCKEYVENENPYRLGGEVFITGVFKL